MALRRTVAELPESVEELALVRFGLVAHRLSAWRFVRDYGQAVETASATAVAERAGLLGSERIANGWGRVGFLQYWASFESLDAWSHRPPHSEWWRKALDRLRVKADIGVYHETFVVPRRNVESISIDCPPVGLSGFGILSDPVGPKTSARDRLGRRTS